MDHYTENRQMRKLVKCKNNHPKSFSKHLLLDWNIILPGHQTLLGCTIIRIENALWFVKITYSFYYKVSPEVVVANKKLRFTFTLARVRKCRRHVLQ